MGGRHERRPTTQKELYDMKKRGKQEKTEARN
jgi:hypothetical protein